MKSSQVRLYKTCSRQDDGYEDWMKVEGFLVDKKWESGLLCSPDIPAAAVMS